MNKLILHTYYIILLFLWIQVVFLNTTLVNAQTDMIIDHRYARLEVLKSIPSDWIDSAKNNLHIRYEHTSHGSQITSGMTNLDAFIGGNGVYVFANNGGQGVLDFNDINSSDLSAGENTWQQKTRDYLDDPNNQDCNVIMWSWCNILGHDGDKDPGYCSKMEELITEYGTGGSKIQSGDRTVPVQFVFMTGHVNGQGEEGETNQINKYIRDHCHTHNRILFDFADIESYDPDDNYFLDDSCRDDCHYNDQGTADGNWATEWIADKVEMTSVGDVAHNEPNGGHWYQCYAAHSHPLNANMKAYAAWYMAARMAGWQTSAPMVLVDSIDIYPEGGLNKIDTDEGTLQLYTEVFPDTATDQAINWYVLAGSGSATIDENGLLTAIENGTIYAVALTQDGSDVSDTLEITITNQITEVENLTLSFSGGQDIIKTGDSIQVVTEILPIDADSQLVELVIEPITGMAAINENGYVIGGDPGKVRISGVATDGYGASDTLELNIVSNLVLLDSLQISVVGGLAIINLDEGSLQLSCQTYPADATYPSYSWSVISESGSASIDENGLLTAIDNGLVYAVVLARDGSDVSDTLKIPITNQITEVESLTLSTLGCQCSIAIGDSLQVITEVLPFDSDSQRVELVIEPVTGTATISNTGYVTGISSGLVRIIGTATDGFGAADTLYIDIRYQPVLVEYIEISTESGDSVIHELGGKLHIIASIYPHDADNKEIIWEITNLTGEARLLEGSIVEGISNGSFIVIAYASDTSGVSSSRMLFVEDQSVIVKAISAGQLTLYPNPARDFVRLLGDIQYPASIKIFNLHGKLFIHDVIQNSSQVMDITLLPQGFYLLDFVNKQTHVSSRFIKR